ncbi:sensor histidine kinase [Flavilitoribacter nigricans]|nr:histidine kinase [Flavilitoribacter nigricans]
MTDEQDIRDIPLMLWLVPGFGIIIPNLTGLFGPLRPSDGLYWLGYVCFIGLAYTIWWGNRWLYLRQRRYFDWFQRPVSKVITVLFANIFYTAPVTLIWCWAWYYFRDVPVDWVVIKDTSLFNVIAVIFITHVYETAFLIKDRETDMLRLAKLEQSRALAELEALKNQVDPHFMFNSLNTLSHLVSTNQRNAEEFIEKLADVYRYILQSKEKDLVQLIEEIQFLNNYFDLLRLRFGSSILLDIESPVQELQFLPPISLQLLLENAVKHNGFDEKQPLMIQVDCREDHILFVNNRRKKTGGGIVSNGIGLQNLNNRFQLLLQQPIEIREQADRFSVKLPLVSLDGGGTG